MYPHARGRTSQSRPGEENVPTVAGASGRVSLRAAGAAKLLLRTKTQATLSPNKL